MRLRGQLHTILEDMDRHPNACLEELEAFMTLWDVKLRVKESSLEMLSVDELITQLRQMCGMRRIVLVMLRRKHNRRGRRHSRKWSSKSTMLNQPLATRVIEALTAAAVTRAASTQEETNRGSNSS
ncbi:hypothetical protein Tco_1537278 [Tanacetum coccineum]